MDRGNGQPDWRRMPWGSEVRTGKPDCRTLLYGRPKRKRTIPSASSSIRPSLCGTSPSIEMKITVGTHAEHPLTQGAHYETREHQLPEPMLDALRDKTLIVFAGAGVSMGPPANLPDFKKLALEVAEGTGEEPKGDETIDRFLTRLKNRGTKVRRIAAEILGRNNPQPTRLHLDLLRLWPNEDSLRIVTTNFDELFEQGANQHGMTPRIFQAPALPIGSRFHGIVHIHGSVTQPEEMILTTEDFGRAYLTESEGWARRFLVDVFGTFTVYL